MRRILGVALLALVLALTLSLPAHAGGTTPPNVWGKYVSEQAPWMLQHYGEPYGRFVVRYVQWYIQSGWSPYDNGGEYIAAQKDQLSD